MSELKNKITRKYLIALIIVGLLDTVSFTALLLAINFNKDNAYLVNISGRQRMLSQRITLILNQIENSDKEDNSNLIEEAQNNIDLFENSHAILTGRSTEQSPHISKEILSFYFDENGLDNAVKYFISRARQILREKTHQPEHRIGLAEFSEFTKGDLLKRLDDAVLRFEERSNNLNRLLVYIEVCIYFISFINLGFILKLLFIPMRNDILKREEELGEFIQKLKQEGEYKSMFLANMGHELRTPLNGILGVTDLIQDTQLSKEQIKLTRIIEESGHNLLHIVDDILDLTKLEMGQVKLNESDFFPEVIISQLTQIYKLEAAKKNLDFEWENINLPPILIGDEIKIKQVFKNLLNNAVKFTRKGGVKVVTEFNKTTNEFIAKIHDTGIGIEHEKLELIFDPFKQADSSTTRLFGGTGLGLSISKQIVTAMRGSLTVASQPEVGTTFTFTIPLRTNHSAQSFPAEEENENQVLLEGDILLIDPNEISQNHLTRIITRQGPLVESALSLKVANRLLSTRVYQIVFISVSENHDEISDSLNGFLEQIPQSTKVYLMATTSDLNLAEKVKNRIEDILVIPIQKKKMIKLLEKNLLS
ncbi:MAG: hypothetical protein CME60_00130 [Halobacteriovoraceae bacterium]|nr:hypothetical protein [Halobacteriovoraceae bacterium]